jgi:5-methylcytosine-specific restriction endonuclease McrA
VRKQACIGHGVVDCPRCGRRPRWQHRASPPLNYGDALYLRNRRILLSGHPMCHRCGIRPATTADHLVGAPYGTHDLSNLVPACADCNRLRGASRGGQVAKAKRKRRG